MLAENDIKAELSYSYLHAVAARAGFGCAATNRHLDNAGVDAQVDIRERLDPGSVVTDFSLHFQLKATSQNLVTVGDSLSFNLQVPHYDKLRLTETGTPRFMALFVLPEEPADWLHVTANGLISRRCARWISLRGAPETENSTTVVVHVPSTNILTPASLREIARRVSLGETLDHVQ